MTAHVDLRGRRFGKLLVLDEAGQNKAAKVQWLCLCDCGARRTTITNGLTSGITLACGGKVCRPPRPAPPPTPHERECKRAYEALIASGGYWLMNPIVGGKPPRIPAGYGQTEAAE